MSDQVWVYIMTNTQRSIMKIGFCYDLVTMVASHRALSNIKFQASHQTILLVYVEVQPDEEQAQLRVKKIKRWPRPWRIALIEKENPEWQDLSLDLSG